MKKGLGEHQVRLVSLIDVGTSGTINLSKQHVSPLPTATTTDSKDASTLSYIALSYVWGEERGHVICDGVEVEVSTNLIAALRQLQKHFKGRLLWTDNLSIDQYNDAEKSHQVSIMGRIFASATATAVWMGDGFDDVYHGLHDESLFVTGDKANSENRVRLLKRISQITWFYRVWTFQEIRLAKDAVVLLGAQMMPWADFISSIQRLRSLEPDLSTVTIWSEPVSYSRYTYRPQDRFFGILDELNAGTSDDLAGLLFLTWYREASEKRDKVYSLLSDQLFNDARHGIHVDYAIDWSTLCVKAARASINTAENLKILKIAGMINRSKSSVTSRWDAQELPYLLQHPSWAPNWWQPPQRTRSHPSLIFDERGIFDQITFCCPRTPPTQDINNISPFLSLNGVLMGIFNVGESGSGLPGSTSVYAPPHCGGPFLDFLRNPENEKVMVPKVDMSYFVVHADEHLHGKCMCVPLHERASHESPFGSMSLALSHLSASSQPMLKFSHWSFPVYDTAYSEATAESEQPAQVLATSVESGDWLVLLEGGGMPFILRPARSTFGRIERVQDMAGLLRGSSISYDAGLFVLVGEASMCWDKLWPRQWDIYCRAGKFVIV